MHGLANRITRRQIVPPGRDLGQFAKEVEVAERLENIEVPEDRTEYRVDDAEVLASEVRAFAQRRFKLLEAMPDVTRAGVEHFLVGRVVEGSDRVEQ